MRYFLFAYFTILTSSLLGQTQSVPQIEISTKPIPCAHSHNDYNKINPLWGALKSGFTSIGVDAFCAHETISGG